MNDRTSASTLATSLPGVARVRAVFTLVGLLLIFLQTALPDIALISQEPGERSDTISQEARQKDDTRVTITFRNGDVVTGVLLQEADSDSICWRADVFDRPVRHGRSPIAHIRTLWRPAVVGTGDDEFFFHLSGGDEIRGRLESWNENQIIVQSHDAGRVSIAVGRLCSLRRVMAAGRLVYSGPTRPDEWHIQGAAGAWDLSRGVLAAKGTGALYGQLGIPERALVEIEFSWDADASFVIELAAAQETNALARPFCIGMMGGSPKTFLTFRETDRAAQASVLDLGTMYQGRAVLRIFLDQRLGEWRVYDHQWRQMGRWVAAESRPTIHGGVRLKSNQGGWQVENLKILDWQAVEIAQQQAVTQPGVLLSDGQFVPGQIAQVDVLSKKVVLQQGEDQTAVELSKVQAVQVRENNIDERSDTTILSHSGTRLSGSWKGLREGSIYLESAGKDHSWKVELDRVEAILFHPAHAGDASTPDVALGGESSVSSAARPTALLEWQGGRLHGTLCDSRDDAVLCWQVAGANEPVGIVGQIPSRIVLRNPPVAPNPQVQQSSQAEARPAVRNPQVRRPPRPNNMVEEIVAGMPRISFTDILKKSLLRPFGDTGRALRDARLYLRNGDVLPVRVRQIDEQGIHVATVAIDAKLIPHSRVKALVFSRPTPPPLDKVQHGRLMTLPRMQRTNPPTHLIAALNGDYLRGRLRELDQQRAVIEILLENQEIPVDRISHIIWLHEDEYTIKEVSATYSQQPGTSKSTLSSPANAPTDLRLQVVMPDNLTVTFTLVSVRDGLIKGFDLSYGQCSFRLESAYELRVVSAAHQTTATGSLALWKLQPAPDPTTLQQAGGEAPAGVQHPLVGKPAPDFRLPSVDGKTITLEQFRGEVVVLDFWASWCGPCLVAMPQVEKAVAKFTDKVRLVAVNLQETPERVRSTLERLKVNPVAAIDEDGAVAAKYRAAAIPQTVVIDGQGKVVRVFVGGGDDFLEQLTEVLSELVSRGGSSP